MWGHKKAQHGPSLPHLASTFFLHTHDGALEGMRFLLSLLLYSCQTFHPILHRRRPCNLKTARSRSYWRFSLQVDQMSQGLGIQTQVGWGHTQS